MAILDLQTLEVPETQATPIDDTLASTSSLSVLNCGTSTLSTLICLRACRRPQRRPAPRSRPGRDA
ncbi:MAG: SapB/AmfS family lantipeptide, partial [Streptomycetaceae bacterium]|nr:SapB/AmfS family lantipeptide [Streptomycetaceae bacterium]